MISIKNKSILTEADYNKTRLLQGAGLTYSQAKKLGLFVRSRGTWSKSKEAASWEDYKAINEKVRLLHLEKVRSKFYEGKPNGKTIVGSSDNEILNQNIVKLQESIDSLSRKLATFGHNEKTLLEKFLGKN